jgi:IS30 family transposase
MQPIDLVPRSDRYLSFSEREEIALLWAQDHGVREIARSLDRSPSTISSELRRNAATRSGTLTYRATVAQWKAERAAEGRQTRGKRTATNIRADDWPVRSLIREVGRFQVSQRTMEGATAWPSGGSALGHLLHHQENRPAIGD